jgi:hypothetical protein
LLRRSRIVAVVTVGSLGALGGLGAVVSACSAGFGNISGPAWLDAGPSDAAGASLPDSSSPSPDAGVPTGRDSGTVDSGAPSDAAISLDAANADVMAPNAPTTILAVNASANLFPFRVCFGRGTSVIDLPPYPNDPTHPMPETNYPGVPVGGAALLPPVQLSGTVTPYVVSTVRLATDSTSSCAVKLCPNQSMPGGDCVGVSEWAALPPITLPPGATVALAVQGCLPFASAPGKVVTNAQCGLGYEGSPMGNLTATLTTLFPPVGGSVDGGIALHVAQLSPSSADASLTYVDPTIDASVALPAYPLAGSLGTFTVPLSEAGVLAASFVTASTPGGTLTESVGAIQFFQAPASNPETYFTAPGPYFTALVGDATDASAPANLADGAPNPAFDGYGLHVIAYPER